VDLKGGFCSPFCFSWVLSLYRFGKDLHLGEIVIAVYRPKPGCEAALVGLAKTHVPDLGRLGLVSDRPATLMQAKGGVIVEVFEWLPGAVEAAHNHPEVKEIWRKYAEICDYVPLASLQEAAELFSPFAPLD
jgi:hypothetical protein